MPSSIVPESLQYNAFDNLVNLVSSCHLTFNSRKIRYGLATCQAAQFVFVIGGSEDRCEFHNLAGFKKLQPKPRLSNAILCFNIINRVWYEVLVTGSGPRPCKRMFHGVCILRLKLYVYGGLDEHGKVLNDLWVFDFVRLAWTILGHSLPRYKCCLTTVYNTGNVLRQEQHKNQNSVMIFKGHNAHDEPIMDLDVYTLRGSRFVFSSIHLPPAPADQYLLVSFHDKRNNVFHNLLLYLSNANNQLLIRIYASRVTEIRITDIDLSLLRLRRIKGFMIDSDNIVVMGWIHNLCHLYLLNLVTEKWTRLDIQCSLHPRFYHNITHGYLWRHHGKMILLSQDASDAGAALFVLLVDISFSNILNFNNAPHDPSKNAETFRQVYKEDLLNLAASRDSDEDLLLPVTKTILPEIIGAGSLARQPDFESYVNYLAPSSGLTLNTNSVAFLHNSAVALGRNFFQRYTLAPQNPLTDFQFLSTDEQLIPVPMIMLLKRWGPFFNYLLGYAYVKSVEKLSDAHHEDARAKRSVASLATQQARKRFSMVPSESTNDTASIASATELKSPITSSLLFSPHKHRKNSHTSFASGSTNTTAPPHAKIVFNSPFENKKIPPTNALSPSLSEALNNYSDFINLPASRKNSVISTTSSFMSGSSLDKARKTSPKKPDDHLASSRSVNLKYPYAVDIKSPLLLEQLPQPDFAPPTPETFVSAPTSPNTAAAGFAFNESMFNDDSHLNPDTTFKEVGLLGSSLAEYLRLGKTQFLDNSAPQTSKNQYLMEPLLTPRTLYLPFSSYTIKALSEFFCTGQLNRKAVINPTVAELFILAKFYEIPLLYNICSEVLYAILGKMERFVVSYLEFFETSLAALIAKQTDEHELRELRDLQHKLVASFKKFKAVVSHFEFGRDFYIEIMKDLSDYNHSLREAARKKAASRRRHRPQTGLELDSDSGYDTDDLDQLSFHVTLDRLHQSKKSGPLESQERSKTLLLRIEDFSSANAPSTELIYLIFEISSSTLDDRLLLRAYYILRVLKRLTQMKKLIEPKIRRDLKCEIDEEVKLGVARKEKQEKERIHQQELENELRKKEQLRVQELERLKVEKERVKEEQRLRKEHLRKLIQERRDDAELTKHDIPADELDKQRHKPQASVGSKTSLENDVTDNFHALQLENSPRTFHAVHSYSSLTSLNHEPTLSSSTSNLHDDTLRPKPSFFSRKLTSKRSVSNFSDTDFSDSRPTNPAAKPLHHLTFGKLKNLSQHKPLASSEFELRKNKTFAGLRLKNKHKDTE